MDDDLILLEYHDNFADNISTLAYCDILKKNIKTKCCYENLTYKREHFEHDMSNFSFEYNFTSTARIKKMIDNAYNLNKFYISNKTIANSKKIKKGILNLKHFQIDDSKLLTKNFIEKIKFNNTDFIKNHDVLEEILQNNSIGMYINSKDINKIDYNFIKKAAKRLNKYLKKPILYIFSKNLDETKLDLCINYKIINLSDWREEFYFLKSCKHKIILNLENSYSQNFWASIISEKSYCYCVYDKSLQQKSIKNNWIPI